MLAHLKGIERYGGNPEPGMQGAEISGAGVVVELEGRVEADGGEGHCHEMQQQVHRLLGRPRPQHDPVRHDRCTSHTTFRLTSSFSITHLAVAALQVLINTGIQILFA